VSDGRVRDSLLRREWFIAWMKRYMNTAKEGMASMKSEKSGLMR
jgi:hypothetical protein